MRPAEKGAFSGAQKPGWYNGEFNYDNVVGADDFFLIDSAFIGQSGPLAVGVPQLPQPMETAGVVLGQPAQSKPKEQASIPS